MCGITGILLDDSLSAENIPQAKSVIKKMTAVLYNRGPDAEGLYSDDKMFLGHRRLSIIDPSEAGAQPMELRPNGPVIAYNGEVYNFSELRRELEAVGHAFRGHSDTEVLLHVYDEWGLNGLKRLEGIFAFALWDSSLSRLVLMRDRLGVKPLFYGNSSLGLAFGSEIKAVLAAGGIDATTDPQAFSEYLWYGNSFEDRTFYSGVSSLPPGHWIIIDKKQRKLSQWWRIEEWIERPYAWRSYQDATEKVSQVLDAAVKKQLVADVPLGIFLSGGIDSSAVAAAAMNVPRRPLASYSASFDFERGVNELPKARQVAKLFNLNHRELYIKGENLPETLLALARAHDEPFADAANIPLYLMCQQLSGSTKVVLQGDGGDELFAGYRRYAILRNTVWWGLWPKFLNAVVRYCGNVGQRFVRMSEAVGNIDPALRMGLLLTVETLADPPESFLNPEWSRYVENIADPFLAYRNAAERFARFDPVQQMLLTDLTVQLPSQFLVKVDRATMAAGIEARVPLLDERVAELAVGMPADWKVNGIQKKLILRDSQRGRLPASILDGPKTGFGVPYEYWLRTSLYEFTCERLLDPEVVSSFGLNRKSVEDALKEHKNGSRDRGFMLWKLLQLALWRELKV